MKQTPMLRIEGLGFSTIVRPAEEWEMHYQPRCRRYVVARMAGMVRKQPGLIEVVMSPKEARRAARLLRAAARRAERRLQ